MQFALSEYTAAVLATMVTRTEHHGDDLVPAVTLGFKITGPNTILDKYGDKLDLRHAIYMAPPDQEQLEGIDNTPLLRTTGIDRIKLKVPKLEGWTLLIDHGIDEGEPIDLEDCTVSKFFLVPFQGGSCELTFIVSTNDVDAIYLGLIGMKLGQEVAIKLLAPEPKPDAIDGSQAAFDADHADAEDDAGTLFAREHGEEEAAEQ